VLFGHDNAFQAVGQALLDLGRPNVAKLVPRGRHREAKSHHSMASRARS
jgi:hypothetical protein